MDERIDSIIDVLKNLGAGYMGMANYQSSLGSYEEAILQLQKRQSDKKVMENTRLAKILYNMGLVYRKMGNIEKVSTAHNEGQTILQPCCHIDCRVHNPD
jgi:tetratricopeptide (TPR) repeat protein